jgi:hypothetical protein
MPSHSWIRLFSARRSPKESCSSQRAWRERASRSLHSGGRFGVPIGGQALIAGFLVGSSLQSIAKRYLWQQHQDAEAQAGMTRYVSSHDGFMEFSWDGRCCYRVQLLPLCGHAFPLGLTLNNRGQARNDRPAQGIGPLPVMADLAASGLWP